MHKRRVFIAIGIPGHIVKALEAKVKDLQDTMDPGIRFSDVSSWHITVCFLGDQSADELNSIQQAMAETALEFEPPKIGFGTIAYGPVGRTPRMIWLVADRETSDRVGAIKADLERRLADLNIRFEQEHRQFNAHVTLARFNAVNRETLPPLELPFTHNFEATGMELMESHPDSGDGKYESLGKFDFEGEESYH